jgi:hypothetical protein
VAQFRKGIAFRVTVVVAFALTPRRHHVIRSR